MGANPRVLNRALTRMGGTLLCLGFLGCASVQGERTERSRDFHARDAVYVSLRQTGDRLDGDFDGDSTLLGPDTINVPRAAYGKGQGFALGWLKRGVAVEAAYDRRDYGAILQRSVAINGLRYYRAGSDLQPYFLLGILFPWLELESASRSMALVGDADITGGIGLQTGLGLSYFLTPRASLDVRGLLSWQSFSRAEGVTQLEAPIENSLDGLGWSLSLGLTIGLVPLR